MRVVDIVPNMSTKFCYQYLEARPVSLYRQLFIKGTRIRAEILYGLTIASPDGEVYTPQEVAEDYGLPLPAVLEAIAYCQSNPLEIAEDHAQEEKLLQASGMNHPEYPYQPRQFHKSLSPQEWVRLTGDDALPG